MTRNLPWWLPFGRVPSVSATELNEQLEGSSQPQILDVRTTLEWSRSHIAGSINVPITELRTSLTALDLDKKRPVVAICLSAHRSIPAVRLLSSRGFVDVVQLQGGMWSWWRKALPTQRG